MLDVVLGALLRDILETRVDDAFWAMLSGRSPRTKNIANSLNS